MCVYVQQLLIETSDSVLWNNIPEYVTRAPAMLRKGIRVVVIMFTDLLLIGRGPIHWKCKLVAIRIIKFSALVQLCLPGLLWPPVRYLGSLLQESTRGRHRVVTIVVYSSLHWAYVASLLHLLWRSMCACVYTSLGLTPLHYLHVHVVV